MTATNDYGRGDRQWEAELHARFLAGDRSAAETLYRTHEAALVRLAVRFSVKSGWDQEEAISAAREAFVDFLPKFRPERGRLTTALYTVIPRRLWQVRQRDRTICCPPNWYPAGHHLREAIDRSCNASSIDWRAGDSQGEQAIEPADTSEDPRDLIDRQELVDRLLAILAKADPRDQYVLASRCRGVTRAVVGKRLGVTPQRVRQIEVRAIERLRESYQLHHRRSAS